MQGNYYGKASFLLDPITAYQGVTQDHSVNISFAYGCKISDSDQSGFSVAIELAQSSDIVIFFGHIDQSMESEEHDQISIRLSDVQSYLIKQL